METTETTTTPPLATYPAMLREMHHARQHGHYDIAAELEERLSRPITVRGREYVPQESKHVMWWSHTDGPMHSRLFLHTIGWDVMLSVVVDGVELTCHPPEQYLTPEAALDACAPARYPAAALRAMGRALDALGVVGDPPVERVRHQEPARECEICGERAQPMGTEPRCREHDNEKGCAA